MTRNPACTMPELKPMIPDGCKIAVLPVLAGELRRCSCHRSIGLLGSEVRDHLLPKKAKGVQYLLMRCRPDCAQQDCLLDTQRLVEFQKADAVVRGADAEFGALLTHLLRRRLARIR